MSAPVFVDTNVLIYAMDPSDPGKQKAAKSWREVLWRRRLGRISIQVLQEFYASVVRIRPPAREEARAEVRDLLAWDPVIINAAILERAWKMQDRFRFSFWDALIVSAAKAASCGYLLTEDLPANQVVDGLLVVNPFQYAPKTVLQD
jgi:predicted nucleic acid-binding protein